MHGIAPYNLKQEGKNAEDVENEILSGILKNGLEIRSGRRLVGTVAFADPSRMSEEEFVNRYIYGRSKSFVIVALPKVLKNSIGEEIYLGTPLYNWNGGGGYEITSLSDALVPDYNRREGILNNMFILGGFKYQEDGKIRLRFNQEHICNNEGIVPDDFFEIRRQRLLAPNQTYNTSVFIIGNASETDLKQNQDLINIDKISKFFEYLYSDENWEIKEKIDEMEKEDDYSAYPKEIFKYRDDWVDDNEPYLIGATAFKRTISQYAKEYYDIDLTQMLSEKTYDFDSTVGQVVLSGSGQERLKQFSEQQIGKATVDTPITKKSEAQKQVKRDEQQIEQENLKRN